MSIEALLILHGSDYRQLISLLKKDSGFEFLYTNIADLPYGKKQLKISREQNEVIVDALTDLIASKGITNGEINDFGLNAERMIDVLSNSFQE